MLYKLLKGFADFASRHLVQFLPDWQPERGQPVLEALAPFAPALPANMHRLPPHLASFFVETISLPARQLFILPNATVSWHAVVFRNFRIFRPALALLTWEATYRNTYLLKQWVAEPAELPAPDEPVALVHDQWTQGNYYHWMVDSLSRLLLLRRHYPNARLLMPEPVPAYVRATAALLGFTRLVPLSESQVLKVPRLVVPQHVAPPGLQNPSLLQQLRDDLVRALHLSRPLPVPTRRLYASRAKQNSRHLRNEAEVVALLQQQGFETVYFEEYSFEQQVALMLETAVLVGLHGANLTNMLFMQPGAAVVEVLNEDKFTKLHNVHFENLIYCRLSSCLGLPYFAVPGRTVPGQEASNYADLEVELDAIRQLLADLPAPPAG